MREIRTAGSMRRSNGRLPSPVALCSTQLSLWQQGINDLLQRDDMYLISSVRARHDPEDIRNPVEEQPHGHRHLFPALV